MDVHLAQDRQQVFVVLNHGTLEPPLPDVSAGAMMLVISLGMGDQKALHDPANRRPGERAEEQVEVIIEQAISVEHERLSFLQVAKGMEKGFKVALLAKHILAIITAIDDVVDQAIFNRSQGARHLGSIASPTRSVNKTF